MSSRLRQRGLEWAPRKKILAKYKMILLEWKAFMQYLSILRASSVRLRFNSYTACDNPLASIPTDGVR